MDKKTSTVLIIVAALLAIGMIPFTPSEWVAEFGTIVFVAPIIGVALLVAIIFFIDKKSGEKNELETKRNIILNELSIAEKDFMQHKMDKDTFETFSQLKNTELIVVESEIDLKKKKDLPKEEIKAAKNLSKDKQKILLCLLGQSQLKAIQMKKSEALYLKRKLSEQTFKKITSDIESEKISIDAQIKAILNADAIAAVKEQLKAGAKEVARQKKNNTKRTVIVKESTLEDDILDQVRIAG